MNSKVAVMLSSYNGEKYIEAQINSIFQQIGVDIDIYIRDDCSNDNTVSILNKTKFEHMYTYRGKTNIGACRSFLELIKLVPNKYEYYAFSDQDDVWLQNKIVRGIQKLERYDQKTPNLYYSAICKVDKNLKELKNSIKSSKKSFEFSLVRSEFPGCTMIFNHATMEILKQGNVKKQVMHDQYVYQIVSGVNGNIFYDNYSFIKYRIHGSNVSDYSSFYKRAKKLISYFVNNPCIRSTALMELLEIYGDLFTDENKKILYNIANYKKRIFYKRWKLGFSIKDKYSVKFLCAFSMLCKKF